MARPKGKGYYWVKAINDQYSWVKFEESAQIAFWDGKRWNFIGMEMTLGEDNVEIISRRLSEPQVKNEQ